MVYQDIDVVFGGGARHLIPEDQDYVTTFGDSWRGKRKDGENLLQVLLDRGYTFVDNKDAMLALGKGPVWGLFDDSHMDPDIDRDDFHPCQPSIAEMTEKAIELLSNNRRGFFLMVEGSQVDWAGHANDPVYMVTDFLAFDEAVGKALEFAEKDGRTLVLVFPDHNTGALSVGHELSDYPPSYTATTIEHLIEPIKYAEITVGGLLSLAYDDGSATAQEIIQLFDDKWSLALSVQEAEHILALGEDGNAVSEYISKNMTVIGWTTHGHTGEDVPLWAYTPNGQCRPCGTLDNTELAMVVARAFGFDLGTVTGRLFVDVRDVFGDFDIEIEDTYVDDDGNTRYINPVLKIGSAEIPGSKDLVIIDGKTYEMNGIVVHAPMIDTMFIPREAIWILNRAAARGGDD
jgi:alkaline phosphatase